MLWLWHAFLYNPLWWPESGPGYAMGSSWLSLSLLGLLYVNWKRHNCHQDRCLRVSRHVITKDGHQELYCRKHKPAKT